MIPAVFILVMALLPMNLMAQAKVLGVGDPAPALQQGAYLKGEPVKEFEPGKVYVLEFWATWCGHCVKAFPHISKLQAQYGDEKVVFIGQNIWERRTEDDLKAFVKQMGEDMSFRVVLDDVSTDPKGAMAARYLTAANLRALPMTFIIDQKGKIAFIGHPNSIEGVLPKILSGTYDPIAEKEKAAKVSALILVLQTKVQPLIQAGEVDKAAEMLENLEKEYPDMQSALVHQRYKLFLSVGKLEEVYALLEKAIPGKIKDARTLGYIAYEVANAPDFEEDRRLDVAKKAALLAVEISERKDTVQLHILADVTFLQGGKEEAITLQKEAISKIHDLKIKSAMEAALKKYMEE